MIPVFSKRDLLLLIRREFMFYRQVELIDYYKLLFQAYYGPTHMQATETEIRAMIRAEISAIEAKHRIGHQDIGVCKAFVRVSLAEIDPQDDEAIDNLTQAIIASKLPGGILWKDWMSHWNEASTILKHLFPPMEMNQIWQEYILPEIIPSHSDSFKARNHPHYRIVRRDLCPWFVKPIQ